MSFIPRPQWVVDLINELAGSAGGVWGSITGTLASQTDLQTALNAKQATLVSGTSIKTVGGATLLGAGDVGTIGIGFGGTGATTAPAALTALGAYPATNPNGYTTNTGTVTSVGGTGTVSGLSLSGTVTTTGNLTLGGTLAVTASNFASQTAATFLAAPNGSAGVPTFRTIIAADIPTLNQSTTGSAATLTTSRNFSISGGGITAAAVGFNGSAVVTLSASVDAGHITLARMADVATASVFYRKTAGTGAPEVQTLATLKTDLGLTSTNSGDQTITLTGDVTGTGTGSFAATIGANKVTNTQLAQVATATFKGRTTAATGNVEDLTATQATALLDVATVSLKGLMSAADKTKLDGVATGATANTGTVTSVSGTGTVNGITLTGSVTTSGSLTLGGTLSGVSLTSQVTGTLPVGNGGIGVATLTSGYLVKGNGASAVSASILYDDGISLGVGVIPSGWGAYKAIDLNTGGLSLAGGNQSGAITLGAYWDTAVWRYSLTTIYRPVFLDMFDGAFTFKAASAGGTVGNTITFNTVMTVNSSGLAVALGGIGYGTGAGGTVAQATSKATGATLNKSTGQITMFNDALAASTSVAFTLTNSSIAATDVVIVNIKSGAASNLSYQATVQAVAAGSCVIALRNVSAGSLSEAVVLQFAVIKGVNA